MVQQNTSVGTRLTSAELLYPFINFLQAEGSFCIAIVLIWVDMEDLLAGTGQSSSNTRSVRLDQDFVNALYAHSASKECLNPVPEITTSHSVSLSFSIL